METLSLTISPLGYEEHNWVAQDNGMVGRRRLARATGPYQSAIVPPIAEYMPALPTDLAADTEEATAALVGFDDYAASTLGLGSPLLGPMSSILLRTESASSSQIENLTVSARQLALAQINQATSHNATIVEDNVRAMEAALALAQHIDESTIGAVQAELLRSQSEIADALGQYRQRLVWVGTSDVGPREASYVAPQPERVPAAMRDLVAFIARDDLPIVIQIALAHAQFESIHPFVDGNGRTGRALVHAILKNKGIVTRTTAPVSAGLLRQTSAYVEALTAYRRGDARPIVERFADAARFAASSGKTLVDDLAAELARDRAKLAGLRSQASAWMVLPHLIALPVIDAATLVSRLGLSEVTSQRALSQLVTSGVLTERTGKRRGRIYQHLGIISILDDYAAALRRT
ncbi:MAG: Fic family protein [Propionibacteriaceae bacterium]|jgi:Fic family protein|nr:Fic family protein [Propionibacteriaceae bacterium]